MTFNTGNPIGSTDARDLSDNAENFDKALGTTAATWVDRFGVTRDTFEGRLAKGSFYRVGDFATGYTLTNMRQTLEYSGHEYGWTGAFPKTVSAGSKPTPIEPGSWVDRTNETVKSDLTAHEGDYNAHPQLTSFITSEADRAEAAADAAMNAAGVYNDTTAGLAATTSSQYFYVPSASTSAFLDLYKNNTGSALFIKSNPSDAVTNELQLTSNTVTDDSYYGLVLDLSNGTAYAQVDELIFGDESKEIGRISASDSSIAFDLMKPEVLETGTMSESDEDVHEEISGIKTIGTSDKYLKFNTDTGELTTTFKIIDESNQTKPAVTRWDGTFPSIYTNVSDPAFLLTNRVYQATPTICRTGSRYWAAWRADINNVGEGNGNFFVIAYSDDNCQTFTEKYILSYDPSDIGHTLIDPMLWTSPDGEMWLLWTMATGDWYPTLRAHDGVGGCFAAIMQNPEGAYQTWGKPFQFKEMGNPRHPVRVNGEYMICTDLIAYSATYPAINSGNTGCTFCKFDYKNKRVIEIGRNSPNYQTTRYTGFFETELIELTDGRLMSMTRMTQMDGGFARSYSDDGGKTWSAQEELNTLLGDISSSRVWLGRLASGRMLLVYNNSTDRTLLTAAISEDDGVTFPYRVVLDPTLESNASYPIVAFNDSGDIYICYDVGRELYNQIRITHVTESDILNATSVPVNTIISDPLA